MEAISALFLVIGMHQALVEGIVHDLGNDEFEIREKMHQLLKKQLEVPWAELLVRGLQKKDRKDLEIKRRIGFLTQPWNCVITKHGKHPWLDALPKNYPDRDKIISRYFNKAEGPHIDADYRRYRHATMLWMEDLKSQGYWNCTLKKIQKQMVVNELYWKKNGRYPW